MWKKLEHLKDVEVKNVRLEMSFSAQQPAPYLC